VLDDFWPAIAELYPLGLVAAFLILIGRPGVSEFVSDAVGEHESRFAAPP
jgi:hypothetical protein